MPQTLTIAQALQSNQSGLTVQDSAANIAAALPNPGLVARVSLFELSGPAILATAAADKLAALGSRFAAGAPITVQDSVAAMILPANAAGLALASSRHIIDAAYNLLAAPNSAYTGVSAVLLSGSPTLSIAQMAKLEGLPGFALAVGAHLALSDALSAYAPALIAHPAWFTAAAAISVRLDGTAVGAGVATALAGLANGGKTVGFIASTGDSTLNVVAAAHDLATAAASLNRVGQLVGVHITVSNDGSAISAADAVALTTITGFAPAQHTLTVSDTGAAITAAGAALFNHGYPQIVVASGIFTGIAAELLDPTLHVLAGAGVSLSGNPTLTAAQIQVLASLPGFALAQGATLGVSDTIGHLIAHAGAMATATTITATDSETTTAAGLTALAALKAAHGGGFNMAGHTVSAADTAANLLGLGNQAIALSGGFSLTANATVNAAQLVTLRDTLHVTGAGHSLTVIDTAADLLGLSGNLGLVGATQLSANATLSAAQAQQAAGLPGFSTAGHMLTIADSAAALLALAPGVQALAAHLVLNADQSVTVAQCVALAGLGSAFSANGHVLIVTDTAANLLALPVGAGALASGFGLSADATVSGAQFSALAAGLDVALNGHALTVADTAANLLAISAPLDAQASGFVLTASGSVTEAQFITLRDVLHVTAGGNLLTVTDSAADLLALSGNLSLAGATQLSGNTTVSAAQAGALAAGPAFSTGGHILNVIDTAAALLGLAPSVQALATQLMLSGDQSVNVSQAGALAALGSVFSDNGHALVVTGTAPDLLALSPGVMAIATGYALTADASVSAAQFTTLAGTLAVAPDGHALDVLDTPANLLALSPSLLGQASGFALSANGTVSESQFVALRDVLDVAANGHSLTVADTASNLLALSGDLSLIGATRLSADATVDAAQAEVLAADPAFSTAGHVLTVADNAAALLALPGGAQALAGALVLAENQTVSASQAAGLAALSPQFSTGGYSLTVSDTAAALLALPGGVGAIASAYALSADASVSAAQFGVLAGTLHVGLAGHVLMVTDTPANLLGIAPQLYGQASGFALSAGGTVSEAQFLVLRDVLEVAAGGNTLTVSDTAADLLGLSGNLALDGATQLSADGTVSAAQAVVLAGEPAFSTAGHVLTVSDSAANLLALPVGVQTLSHHLVMNANQSVTVAQLAGLMELGGTFSTGGHSLTVTDTAADLAAMPQGLGSLATGYALSAAATVSAAQLASLSVLGVALNGHALICADTPANLLALPGGVANEASGFALNADGTVSAAQFFTLRDTLGVAADGHALDVIDSAVNLLSLSGNLSLIGSTALSGNANVTASQATLLAAEPGFSAGGHVLGVVDTAAALLGLSPAVLDVAGSYALSGNATVSAAQLDGLALGLNVALNGHTLTVADAPANLLAIPVQALGDATAFLLSAGGTVDLAQFFTLRDTLGVAGNGHTLAVADSAANLLALSGNLALVSATQLTADANLSASQAESLAAEPGFSAGGHVLTITDTAFALLGLPGGVQMLSGHLVLAASQSVSAAQAGALAGLGVAFSTGGQVLTVTDTAAALLSLPPGVAAIAGGYGLSADATVSASQFTALASGLDAALNGHALTVIDTPANLLGLAAQILPEAAAFELSTGGTVNAAQFTLLRDTLGVQGNGHTLGLADSAANLLALSGSLALVSATQLTGNANVTASQAQSLAAETGFSTGGYVLTVTDSAANLLALTTDVQTLSGHLVLAGNQSVTGTQAAALAALGVAFSTGGHALVVSDTAADLLSLPLGVAAIATGYALSADATVSASQFTALAGLDPTLAGHQLVVSDTAANLLSLTPQALPLATGVSLSADGTVSESQFVWLRDSAGVAGNGHLLTVADSAANLLALSGNLALVGATQLTGNATLSAAQAVILAAEPGFSLGGHLLNVIDSAANLLALPSGVQTLSGHLILGASQSVSGAQASGLAALGAAFSTGGNMLTVSDTAATLLSLPGGVAAIAGAYALSADATVNASQFATLATSLDASLAGHALVVSDTPANLLAVPVQTLPYATGFSLSAGGVVSEAQFDTLRDVIGVAANGHTLTVSDTAADLLALSGNLALDGATQLSADGSLSAAQAVILAGEPGFSTAGHVLTIVDTAAILLTLPTGVQLLSGHLVLGASQSVSAAQATGLAALGGAFSTGGNTLTVTDTAINLLALPGGVAAIAGAYALSADATVNAAQFTTLRDVLNVATGGHAITIVDTAPNLAAITGSMASASAVFLSASGTVSAAGAAVLNADPGFSTAGHTLTIADTVANLLALGTPLQSLANAFTLSANQTCSVAQLAGLAAYGIKFTDGGYALGVSDTAANLATLTGPELALASTETMSQSATVNAATAASLAALPGFALGGGVVMTVQDSAANLLALSGAALSLASSLILPPGSVSLSAAQAAGLHALAHFSTGLATITVTDSVVNLQGNAGWSAIAAYTHVIDAAAILAANASSALLQYATSVTLLANATVTASQAVALASIPTYSTGSFSLTVNDSPAAIAQDEASIAAVATSAVVNTTGTVTAAQADMLALLSNAGKLSFQAGDSLTVADNYAALASNANSTGLALASHIVVADSAANLVAASSHDWGDVVPTYVLSAGATITGAQAVVLAGLGSHFQLNGQTLSVQDNAANVVADASALTSLGITATVHDTAADIGALASALNALGGRLAGVAVTDGSAISGATAAALAPLAAKLSGEPVAVADSAAGIETNLAALESLGGHVAIMVSDGAAAIGADAADLSNLGAALSVSLTNVGAVTAATAAALAPIAGDLVEGTSLAVSDTVANLAAQASTLAAIGYAIGTVGLIGGGGASAAQAVALEPLLSHLGSGVQLSVSVQTADLPADFIALAELRAGGHVTSVTDSGESIATVLSSASLLNGLNAIVNVSDTLADFNAAGADLSEIPGLAGITITDTAVPVFSRSLSQYASEAPVLGLVTNLHSIDITDTAAAIEADLASGSSILMGITSPLSLAVTGGAPLVLSQTVALTPGVSAVLASFTGTLEVTYVTVAHLSDVAALSPQSIAMSDSTADIATDLVSGNSAILANITAISSIVASGGTISLTASQALAAHVDDGAGSVFAKLSGAGLAVTGASVAQVGALEALGVPPGAISVSDTAANIEAALTNPGSAILASPGTILSLHVSNASPIVLTEAQDVAAGVNDSSSAALSEVSGAAIEVTGVSTAELGTIEGQARVPDEISVSDTGSAIAGALGTLLADMGNLGPITLTSGVVTLSVAQALTAHVADGSGSLVSLLPSQFYAVAGASVAQLAALTALPQAPGAIHVLDTSADIAADIAGSASQIAQYATDLTVSGGVLTLSDAQAHGILVNSNSAVLGILTSGQTIDVTGVPVNDIGLFSLWQSGQIAAGVTLHLEVADTALALATDIAQGGASVLSIDAAYVNSVTLTGSGGTLNPTQLSAVAGIAGLNANGIFVPVTGDAADIAALGSAARALAGGDVSITDTANNFSAQLATLQSIYDGHLSITLISGTLSVTAANYTADHATIAAITNAGAVTVTGDASDIAALAGTLSADGHVGAVQITDTAANVAANMSTLTPVAAETSVTLTDSSNVSASTAQALVGASFASLSLAGSVGVTDTGSQIAAMAEAGAADTNFLISRGAVLSANSNVSLVDATALNSLGGSLDKNSHVIDVWDTASHLTAPGASATLTALIGGGLVDGIYLKTNGGTVTLNAATALALLAIPGINIDNPDSSANTITVADTAAHLDADYGTLLNNADIYAIVINASATVSVATLDDLQSLGATVAMGIALTVSDTAANIVAASGVTGATVQASAWNLSASASVSSADALTLAALSNFSPAGHTLSVALGANTALGSVSAANELGALGAALIVTGHYYTIGGSVSALTGLTSAGAVVAHVALSDTLAHISALSAPTPLLSGTVAVTDAESLTATQAQSFLALLSAAGVADGNVSFTGGLETVTDTVANLQALTSSTAWTGNAALQSHFSLVADDSASNLDAAGNAAFLAGVPSKILSATATVSASNATALAALSGLSLGGHNLILSDSAANLLNGANSTGLALATSIILNGGASLNAAQAEQLLQITNFALTQTLTITDNSGNLLDGTLSGLIAGHAQVHVALAAPETLDAQTAAALVSLQGFSDTTDMNIVDSSSYLLAAGASAAESMAASVALAGNETVSANTVLRLSEIPHFISTGGTLTLAGNDFANAATLKAIADMGSNFTEGGHSLTLTQDDLGLTPAEYAQIQSDGFIANGHVLSAVLVNDSITEASNTLTLTATGVAGASVTIYDHAGTSISSTPETNASFTLTTPDTGATGNFSITETVNSVESAPVVVLTQSTLESYVAGVSANFANSGQIQVGTGEYISLYTAGATLPNAPALVYDPTAHTISLDIPSNAPIVLITLGASTHPASLDPSEILIKHHS